jgi:hypothetical protein
VDLSFPKLIQEQTPALRGKKSGNHSVPPQFPPHNINHVLLP